MVDASILCCSCFTANSYPWVIDILGCSTCNTSPHTFDNSRISLIGSKGSVWRYICFRIRSSRGIPMIRCHPPSAIGYCRCKITELQWGNSYKSLPHTNVSYGSGIPELWVFVINISGIRNNTARLTIDIDP